MALGSFLKLYYIGVTGYHPGLRFEIIPSEHTHASKAKL